MGVRVICCLRFINKKKDTDSYDCQYQYIHILLPRVCQELSLDKTSKNLT